MGGFISSLIGGASALLGGIGNMWGGPGESGTVLGLAAQIFGGTDDDPWGLLDSPVFGHVVGAVGTEFLRPDPPTAADIAEERRRIAEEERRSVRANYGLSGAGGGAVSGGAYTPPAPRGLLPQSQATAAKYLPSGRLV